MRGRPFEVGNKMGRGRPRGSRNRKTAWLEVMEEHGLALVKKCVIRALEGDTIALRLCMERLLPVSRDRSVQIRMPKLNTCEDVAEAAKQVVHATAKGKISPTEAESITHSLEGVARMLERKREHEEESEKQIPKQVLPPFLVEALMPAPKPTELNDQNDSPLP